MAKKDVVAQSVEVTVQYPIYDFYFVVVNPFGAYQKGNLITSDDAIQTVISNGDDINCNRINRS